MRSDGAGFDDVAAAVATQLADGAIWHDGRCNWLAATSGAGAGRSGRAALGPTLYAGTAGVAVFLAEAAVRYDDARLRATALGATRHALRHAWQADGGEIGGLHGGIVGIAWAAARAGLRLGDAGAVAGAGEVLAGWRRAAAGRSDDDDCDLLTGHAGTLAGLLALTELRDEAWLVAAAARAGRRLVELARISPDGWSWPSRAAGRYDLCGLAHGAAGIGHALLELHALTGDGEARDAADAAFAYERSWLERRGSWPDLRGIDARVPDDVAPPASSAWCSGTGGIALARVRALELGDDDAIRADARAALAHVLDASARLRERPPGDFSLCHGAAGMGDVLLEAGERRAAENVGWLGIERHHGSREGFPCSRAGGPMPGLLLGIAGIGMFYLRLADSSVPTPLLVGRGMPLTRRASRASVAPYPRPQGDGAS